jgi:hypothetical protein
MQSVGSTTNTTIQVANLVQVEPQLHTVHRVPDAQRASYCVTARSVQRIHRNNSSGSLLVMIGHWQSLDHLPESHGSWCAACTECGSRRPGIAQAPVP